MVKVSSFLAALLAFAPLVSLAMPYGRAVFERDFTDIEASLKARGLEFTSRDIDSFISYLEARNETPPPPRGSSGTSPSAQNGPKTTGQEINHNKSRPGNIRRMRGNPEIGMAASGRTVTGQGTPGPR